MQMYDEKNILAQLRRHQMRWLGTGNGTVPTLDIGHNVTLLWIATGRIKITWSENPGTFVGIGAWTFRDTTQGNVKNFGLTAGLYPAVASTFTLEIDLWNASGTAVDLQTTNYLDLEIVFSELKNP